MDRLRRKILKLSALGRIKARERSPFPKRVWRFSYYAASRGGSYGDKRGLIRITYNYTTLPSINVKVGYGYPEPTTQQSAIDLLSLEERIALL